MRRCLWLAVQWEQVSIILGFKRNNRGINISDSTITQPSFWHFIVLKRGFLMLFQICLCLFRFCLMLILVFIKLIWYLWCCFKVLWFWFNNSDNWKNILCVVLISVKIVFSFLWVVVFDLLVLIECVLDKVLLSILIIFYY